MEVPSGVESRSPLRMLSEADLHEVCVVVQASRLLYAAGSRRAGTPQFDTKFFYTPTFSDRFGASLTLEAATGENLNSIN